jgi:hypothetical protein
MMVDRPLRRAMLGDSASPTLTNIEVRAGLAFTARSTFNNESFGVIQKSIAAGA